MIEQYDNQIQRHLLLLSQHAISLYVLCLFKNHKQISDIFVTALNQGLVQFELKADIRIIVYMTQQTSGKSLFFLSWTFGSM